MSKKYRLIPIFNKDRTVESEDLKNIENGISILSKTLKRNNNTELDGSLILMVKNIDNSEIDIDDVKKLENIFKNQAIIFSKITDLTGYIVEEFND